MLIYDTTKKKLLIYDTTKEKNVALKKRYTETKFGVSGIIRNKDKKYKKNSADETVQGNKIRSERVAVRRPHCRVIENTKTKYKKKCSAEEAVQGNKILSERVAVRRPHCRVI